MRFENKVVIVTGAAGANAGGSGRAAARKFAEEGAKVVMADINEKVGRMVEAEYLEKGYDVMFIPCDLAVEDQIKEVIRQTVEKYGKIDILVNLAYIAGQEGSAADLTTELFDKTISVNLRGHFLFCKYAIPELIKQESSAIVNLASTSAIQGDVGYTAYGAAKAGVTSMTRSIATHYGRNNLRCNTVLPGFIMDPQMQAMIEKMYPERAAYFKSLDKHILLNRHGVGEDIANAILFLASDDATYITGQTLVVDGGISAHSPMWADQMGF